MQRRFRIFQSLAVAVLGFSTVALAQEATDAQPPAAASPGSAPEASAPAAAPGAEPAAGTGEPTVAQPAAKPKEGSGPMYGVGARWRWISVPGWLLDAFTQKNVALSTFSCFGLEGFRRQVDKDDPNRSWELVAAVGYQNMSPPDGYWLGKGKDPNVDTDLVQARDLSLITMDVAFISRQFFNPNFGIHYGAGLGLAVLRGKVLRTSALPDPAHPGGFHVVRKDGVEICNYNAACNEQLLNQSEGPGDQATDPHRFQDQNVPPALPIINLLIGIDGRIPIPDSKQAVEIRLEGGFFDAFFVGMAVGYSFQP